MGLLQPGLLPRVKHRIGTGRLTCRSREAQIYRLEVSDSYLFFCNTTGAHRCRAELLIAYPQKLSASPCSPTFVFPQ